MIFCYMKFCLFVIFSFLLFYFRSILKKQLKNWPQRRLTIMNSNRLIQLLRIIELDALKCYAISRKQNVFTKIFYTKSQITSIVSFSSFVFFCKNSKNIEGKGFLTIKWKKWSFFNFWNINKFIELIKFSVNLIGFRLHEIGMSCAW